MDHVLEGLNTHYEVLMYWFVEEHKSGQYKRLKDNPYYLEVKAIIDSMNCIRKYLKWEPLRLSEEVRWRMEDCIPGVY
jgi:hypothetical protein